MFSEALTLRELQHRMIAELDAATASGIPEPEFGKRAAVAAEYGVTI